MPDIYGNTIIEINIIKYIVLGVIILLLFSISLFIKKSKVKEKPKNYFIENINNIEKLENGYNKTNKLILLLEDYIYQKEGIILKYKDYQGIEKESFNLMKQELLWLYEIKYKKDYDNENINIIIQKIKKAIN